MSKKKTKNRKGDSVLPYIRRTFHWYGSIYDIHIIVKSRSILLIILGDIIEIQENHNFPLFPLPVCEGFPGFLLKIRLYKVHINPR